MKKLQIIILFLFVALASWAQGIEKYIPDVPNPPRLVNDYLNLLSPSQRDELERKLVAYDDSTSNQIAVITIGDIGDYDISDFAVALGRKWGVGGQKEFSNGIVLVILIDKERNQRKVWIATGYGLEGAIPDITAKQIIENDIIPNFKANDIYRGLDEGTSDLMRAAAGEYKAPAGYSKRGNDGGGSGVFLAIIIFIVIMIIISRSGRGGGGMMSRRGYRGWNSPVWWLPTGGSGGGGGGWSGGSSGGGFGGFGGGSFGGGGAGGSW
jgi:uncharacterized protein